jgi:hypothetical protein
MRHLSTPLLLTTLLLASPAAPATEPAVLPPVTTELKRDGRVLPYGQINTVLRKLAHHGQGLFRLDFRVDTSKSKLALTDIRLAVRSDDADYPIRLADDGRFDLPLLPEAEAKTADLATNAPKGQMAIRGTIELTMPPEQLTMGKVRQIIGVARTLREELLPWYLRWLFPRIQAVRVCSATPTWELEWRENGQLLGLPLPVAPGERDPEANKADSGKPCTLLTGQESWPDAARLLPPPNTRLSVKL